MAQTRQTRAEYLRGYIKAQKDRRKAQLVELLGNRCARCGATDDLAFDHIDPATKRFSICSDLTRRWELLVEEALKCQLLCPPCHREKGYEDRPEVEHSYYRYWYHGCRCSVCRAANAAKSARLREQQHRKAWEKSGNDGAVPTLLPSSGLPRLDSNQEPAG